MESSVNRGVLPGLIFNPRPEGGQRFITNVEKKNKLRLNDQLIPKPTDVNLLERMSRIPAPREHPYSSHISRFALFPSQSPGVRAVGCHPLTPSSALLSKTYGGAFRHERRELVEKRGTEAEQTNPTGGEHEETGSSSPETVLPKPGPQFCSLCLSVGTGNGDSERTRWLTSYQIHYADPIESGPVDPLQREDQQGLNPLPTSLGKQSHPGTLGLKSQNVNTDSEKVPELLPLTDNNLIPGLKKYSPAEGTRSSGHGRSASSALPDLRPVDGAGTADADHAAPSLTELQDSFSRSSVHRRFRESNPCAAVQLRDHGLTGRKHKFYGINGYYLHG